MPAFGNASRKTRTFLAAVAPSAAEDGPSGYVPGDRWVDTAGGATYTCTDATAAAAVWLIESTGGAAGAPAGASYVTIGFDATLTSERTLAVEAAVLSLTDGGANNPVTVGVAPAGITNAKLRNSSATSVIGRSAGSVGVPADIAATADGQVLTRSAGALVFAAPAPASVVVGSANVTITDDTWARATIVDAAATATSAILCSVRAPTAATDLDDAGWSYAVQVVARAVGSFDVVVTATPLWTAETVAETVTATVSVLYLLG